MLRIVSIRISMETWTIVTWTKLTPTPRPSSNITSTMIESAKFLSVLAPPTYTPSSKPHSAAFNTQRKSRPKTPKHTAAKHQLKEELEVEDNEGGSNMSAKMIFDAFLSKVTISN